MICSKSDFFLHLHNCKPPHVQQAENQDSEFYTQTTG